MIRSSGKTLFRGRVTLWILGGLLAAGPATGASPKTPGPGEGQLRGVPRVTRTGSEWSEFCLRRAVLETARNENHRARDFLVQCDLSSAGAFPGADRAAFLLAYLHVEGKETDALITLARRVAAWPEQTVYTRWIGYQLLLLGTRDQSPPAPSLPFPVPQGETADLIRRILEGKKDDFPRTVPLLAAMFLREGEAGTALRFLEQEPPRTPAGRYVQALAMEQAGEDAGPLWQEIARSNPGSVEEIDIVGLAAFRLVRAAAARGENPLPFVDLVPESSRYRRPARHVLAMFLAERDQRDAAEDILTELWNTEDHPDRDQAGLFLAGEILEEDRPAEAYALYGEVMTGWTRRYEELTALETEAGRERLWAAWNRTGFWPQSLFLDMNTSWDARESMASRARNLGEANDDGVEFASPTPEPWTPATVAPPGPGERAALLEIESAALTAMRDWEEARWKLQLLEEDLARRLRYQNRGIARIDTELEGLLPVAGRLDSLSTHREEILARLLDLKNRFKDRFHRRTAELLAQDAAQLNWLRALRRFHVEGPNLVENEPPSAEPTPGSLLQDEELLGNSVEALLLRFRESMPARLDDSFSRVWAPRLEHDGVRMAEHARELVAGLEDLRRRLETEAESTRADENLARTREELLRLEAVRDTLNHAYQKERHHLAQTVVEHALEKMTREKEAVDYGLAASLYEWSSNDSLMALVDSSGGNSHALRAEGRERLSAFLTDYPEAFARGETRFRLADLLLLDAKDEFNRKMQGFLAGEATSTVNGKRPQVPFVDYEPALVLYREILAGDPEYPHRDAVLFNLGMILTDVGDARGVSHLTALVEEHPGSPFIQEATLRLADDRFDVQDFAACVPLYQKAAAGEDPGFAAIALYRMGWAEFSRDRFEPAADAFRRLLDLYHHHTIARSESMDGATPWPTKTDLRAEAQDYLVHSLARGGGAKLFARYFEEIGPRSYEPAVLQGLAQLSRDFSQYAAAVEADSMFIRRFPSDPMALASAKRLVDSFDQWNHPEEARRARLKYGEHFLPGSAWYLANRSGSLHQEATEFSRSAYHHLALYHHRRAQKTKKNTGEWHKALEYYEVLLRYWAGHAEAPRYHLYAGEAAAGLNLYSQALGHYESAVAGLEAAPDSNRSLIVDTDWQRVAISDAWYRSTMTDGAAGDPAVAADLLKHAQLFLDRHPGDERAPEAVWRKGSVAFVHEWYSQAAVDYGYLTRYYPGDPNAPRAGALRGDCFYRSKKFDLARNAYEDALVLIHEQGADSLAKRIEPIVPLCAYRHAENTAESDAAHPEKAAALFAEVAATWPRYEHAGLSLYRAGLGYAAAGRAEEAAASWDRLLAEYPDHEYSRDAHLKTAEVWENNDRPSEAALAYRKFSEAFPEDANASGSLLKAAELWTSAGNETEADAVRLDYIRRFPEDHETAMSILEELGERDLNTVSAETPISSLVAMKKVQGSRTKEPASHLGHYLQLAKEHPELASPEIQARVQFLLGEEAYAEFAAVSITLPLEDSIREKKTHLERLLQYYGACGEFDAPRWARGSTYRIGEALIHFGESLLGGERPADLTGDDLLAYEEVLEGEAWSFYDQGEAVWGELLRKTREAEADPGDWITRTRDALWPRLAEKFLFMPEVEYPLARVEPPLFDPSESSGMAKAEDGTSGSAGKGTSAGVQ